MKKFAYFQGPLSGVCNASHSVQEAKDRCSECRLEGCICSCHIQPIDLGLDGPKNRNLRRRIRYREKKIREAIEDCSGISPLQKGFPKRCELWK